MPEKSWRLRPYLGYDWIAGVALPRAWGNEGAPSHLISDLASEGHPCSWKERHRLKSENAPRDASSPKGA